MSEEALDTLVIDDAEAVEPEAVESEEVEAEAVETDETAENEPEKEGEARVDFTPEQKARVTELQYQTTQRYLQKLEKEQELRQAAEEKLARLQPQQEPGQPTIPDLPDPFDDDYIDKMTQYRAAVEKAAQFEVIQKLTQHQQQQEAQAREQAQMAELNQTVTAYSERAKKLGIKADELKIAGQQVGAVGLPQDLVQHILSDDFGPRVTTYLAANYDELEKVQKMSPIKAALYIEAFIKPKAAERQSKSPPPPVSRPKGAGMPEGKLGGKGLVIE